MRPQPTDWFVAPVLEELDLAMNSISGPLPSAGYGGITVQQIANNRLRVLDLERNQLTGSIPEGALLWGGLG